MCAKFTAATSGAKVIQAVPSGSDDVWHFMPHEREEALSFLRSCGGGEAYALGTPGGYRWACSVKVGGAVRRRRRKHWLQCPGA